MTPVTKKGRHSVGVARQYCGQVGKQENCRVAVSLSVATLEFESADRISAVFAEGMGARRRASGESRGGRGDCLSDQAGNRCRADPRSGGGWGDSRVVLADTAYGNDSELRGVLNELELQYLMGVQSSMTVWEPGKQPLPAKPRGKMGLPPRLLQRSRNHHPVSVKQLAMSLLSAAFREVTWREGTAHKLRSRFAAVRVCAAHGITNERSLTRRNGC